MLLSFTKNDCMLIFQFSYRSITLVRVFHKLLEIFQKVSFNFFLKKSLKVAKKKKTKNAFYNESCSKFARKNNTFFGLVLNMQIVQAFLCNFAV